MQSGNPTRVLITLAVAFAILRLMSIKRGRLRVEFDEGPATYQQLGLYFLKRKRAGTLRLPTLMA